MGLDFIMQQCCVVCHNGNTFSKRGPHYIHTEGKICLIYQSLSKMRLLLSCIFEFCDDIMTWHILISKSDVFSSDLEKKKQNIWTFFSLPLRLDEISDQRQDKASVLGSQKYIDVPTLAPSLSPERLSEYSGGQASTDVNVVLRRLEWARSQGRLRRARRHTHSRGSRGHHYPHQNQLMRVGCVLGTCQVQNLSHRLYQLIGQSGREDSSPINPKSPHSYGWIRWPL